MLESTAELLAEVGYGRLSLEAIARRAGTTKPALYRRWPARQHLVLDAVSARLGAIEPPESECTVCALTVVVELSIRAFERVPEGVLAALLADCIGDAALYERFSTLLLEPPRRALDRVLRTSVARGDLRADLDVTTAVSLLSSHIAGCALRTAPGGGEATKNVALMLLHGMARDYASLIGRCEGERGEVADGG